VRRRSAKCRCNGACMLCDDNGMVHFVTVDMHGTPIEGSVVTDDGEGTMTVNVEGIGMFEVIDGRIQ
jgi:hypothetical protein